jgi:hypothetical protein
MKHLIQMFYILIEIIKYEFLMKELIIILL